jgi:hypothetical protein
MRCGQVAIVSATILVIASLPAGAQPSHGSSIMIEGGPSMAVSRGYSGGIHGGLHIGAGLMRWATARWGIRADIAANTLSASGAEPSCIPGGRCVSQTFVPSQLYGAGVAFAVRPAGSPRVQLSLGAGWYLADGMGDSPWSSAVGIQAGARVTLRADGHGLGVDIRYQHFAKSLGEVVGLFAPALSFTF